MIFVNIKLAMSGMNEIYEGFNMELQVYKPVFEARTCYINLNSRSISELNDKLLSASLLTVVKKGPYICAGTVVSCKLPFITFFPPINYLKAVKLYRTFESKVLLAY